MTNPLDNLTASVPHWGAKLAHGESTNVDGQDILPVAFVMFGFGGGEGSGEMPDNEATPAGRGEGNGGGGGGYALPMGAYVGGPDGVRFRPNLIALMVVAIPLVSTIGWALSRIIRSAK